MLSTPPHHRKEACIRCTCSFPDLSQLIWGIGYLGTSCTRDVQGSTLRQIHTSDRNPNSPFTTRGWGSIALYSATFDCQRAREPWNRSHRKLRRSRMVSQSTGIHMNLYVCSGFILSGEFGPILFRTKKLYSTRGKFGI
jgi:hypothetical protein